MSEAEKQLSLTFQNLEKARNLIDAWPTDSCNLVLEQNTLHCFIFLHCAIMPCANIDSESQSSVTTSNYFFMFSSMIFPESDLSLMCVGYCFVECKALWWWVYLRGYLRTPFYHRINAGFMRGANISGALKDISYKVKFSRDPNTAPHLLQMLAELKFVATGMTGGPWIFFLSGVILCTSWAIQWS